MFLLQSVADVVNYVSKLSLMVSYLSENCAHIISQIAHQPATAHLQFTYTIIIMRFKLEKKVETNILVWYPGTYCPVPTAHLPFLKIAKWICKVMIRIIVMRFKLCSDMKREVYKASACLQQRLSSQC